MYPIDSYISIDSGVTNWHYFFNTIYGINKDNTLILSDGRKCVAIKDAAQAVGVSTQMALRVMKKFSYVFGETVVEQYDIPESAYFYPSLTTISQYLQLLGRQAVQMIQPRQGNQSVIALSRFI